MQRPGVRAMSIDAVETTPEILSKMSGKDNPQMLLGAYLQPLAPLAELQRGAAPLIRPDAIASVPGVGVVNVNLVWDPAWTPDRMSDEARLVLNMW